jgi:hypothetical protein
MDIKILYPILSSYNPKQIGFDHYCLSSIAVDSIDITAQVSGEQKLVGTPKITRGFATALVPNYKP